jgi:hypothetical protein
MGIKNMILDLYLNYLNEQVPSAKSFWRRERERVREYSKKLPPDKRNLPYKVRRERMWKKSFHRPEPKFFVPLSQR